MAKSRSIGSIYAELTLKDKMSKGISSAQKSLGKFADKLAGKALAFTGLGVTAGFAAVTGSIYKAIEAGGDLADMMARTGASGEGLVVMQRAFENAGIAASSVPDALQRIQKALAGTDGKAFEAIGLSVDELLKMDPADAFAKISNSISSIENPAQRTKAATDILGKSGMKMMAVFNDPSAFIKARKQVGGLGKTLSENAEGLDNVGDSMSALSTKYTQLGATLAVSLLPMMEDMAKSLDETDFSSLGEDIKDLTGFFVSLGKEVGHVASNLWELSGGWALDPMVAGIAGMQKGEGKALPTADVMINGIGDATTSRDKIIADNFPAGFDANTGGLFDDIDSEKMAIAAGKASDAIAEISKEIAIATIEASGNEDAIKRLNAEYEKLENIATLTGLGVPQSQAEALAKNLEDLRNREAISKDSQPSEVNQNWDSPAKVMVNEYQRRGLSLDSNPQAQDKQKETNSILKEIRDVLKNPKNRQPVW